MTDSPDQKPKKPKPVSDDERGFVILTREEAKARNLSGFHFQKTPAHAFAVGLSGAAHDVLGCLLLFANKAGFCRPVSYDTMATNVRRSPSTVYEAVKELEGKRVIQVTRDLAASRKSKKTNRYRILYEYEVALASPKNRKQARDKSSEKSEISHSEKSEKPSPKNRKKHLRKIDTLLNEELVLEKKDSSTSIPPLPPPPSNFDGGKVIPFRPLKKKKPRLKAGKKIVAGIRDRVCQLNPKLDETRWSRSVALWSALERQIGIVDYDVAVTWPEEFSGSELASWQAVYDAIWMRVRDFQTTQFNAGRSSK